MQRISEIINFMNDTGTEKNPGTTANEAFVANMREQYPELEEQIPEGCRDCSTAWSRLSRGHAEKLDECLGRSTEMVGSVAVMMCHYGSGPKR